MTLDELKKIVAQIKRYKLESKIKDINEWFASLNKTQVNNFISLDIELSKYLQKNRHFLVDLDFLRSEYYLEDLAMINDDTIAFNKASILYEVASNVFSFESEYHRDDMKRLYSQCLLFKIESMAALAINPNSLGNDYHEFSMGLIESVRDDRIAPLLSGLASNNEFLKCVNYKEAISLVADAKNYDYARNLYEAASSAGDDQTYLYEDMKKIAKAKTKEISSALLSVAKSKPSISSEYHVTDMDTIFNAKNAYVAACLAEVAVDNGSLGSEHHEADMQCILGVKNVDILEILGQLARNTHSLNSCYHRLHMDLMSRAKTEKRAKALYKVSVNRDSLVDQQHERNLKLISNVDTDDKADLLGSVAVNCCFIGHALHPEVDMSLIYDAKSILKATRLAKIATDTASLKSKFHDKDMQLIYAAKDEKTELDLFHLAKDASSLWRSDHEFVMIGIANSGIKKPINMALNMAESYCDGDGSKEIDPRVFSIGSKYKKNN